MPIARATAFSQVDLARENAAEADERVATEHANLSAAQHRVERDEALDQLPRQALVEARRRQVSGVPLKNEFGALGGPSEELSPPRL